MNPDRHFQKVYEKAEIIIEIGTVYTRLGYQTDMLPRKIMRTSPILFHSIASILKSKKELKSFDTNKLIHNVDDFTLRMEEFLNLIFEQEIVISPKEKSIVLIYNYYIQDDIANTIAKLLFKKFEVSKISFLVGNVLPLYITGHFSGIVLDAGFCQTTATPVYEGYSLLHVGGNVGLGSIEVSRLLLKNLLNENFQILQQQAFLQVIQSPEWIEEVKGKIGKILPRQIHLTILDDDELKSRMSQSKITIPIVSTHTLQVSYYAITTAFTFPLFGDVELEEPNIAYGFLKLVNKLHSMELAKKAIKNVLICGGLSLVPNFIERFKEELLYFVQNYEEFKRLKKIIPLMNLTQTSNHPSNLNWIGAALLAQIQATDRFSLGYQQFKENGYLLTNKSDAFNFIPLPQEKKPGRFE